MKFDQEWLHKVIHYEPATGEFWWLEAIGQRIHVGDSIGYYDADGYLKVQIRGEKYFLGRLAFFYMTGRWPIEIDHINGTRDDDRWCNLREATRSENVANSDREVGAAGLRGVKWDVRASVWRARVAFRGIRKYVGAYATKEEAYEAYLLAVASTHGEFALHNRPTTNGA